MPLPFPHFTERIMKLFEPKTELIAGDSADRQLIIKKTQEITPEFLDNCRQARFESTDQKMGDFHRFASIPVSVHEKWLREGFDLTKENARSIIKKLQSEDLGAFITTTKKF